MNNTSVLLIEDDHVDAEIVSRMLSSADSPANNYRLTHVDRLEKGIQKIIENGIDAILLDVSLPDSQGLRTITRIRSAAPELPIILLTGLEDETFAMETLKNGAQDYIMKKRLNKDGLIRTINYATERAKTQSTLNLAARQRTSTMMAGGMLSHVNCLLQGVMTDIHNLLEHAHDQDIVEQIASTIISRTEEAQTISHQIETYLHGGESNPKTVDINAVIRGTLPTEPSRIQIRWDLEEYLNPTEIDPAQAQWVLKSIFTNAEESIPNEGVIEIRSRNITVTDDNQLEYPDIPTGDYATVTISDTGTGMDRETKGHIFEPFFTTKQSGRGLGLATVYGIMTRQRRHIKFQSHIGVGTAFQLFFPTFRSIS